MPQLAIRKASKVPLPSRTGRAIREQQRIYEDFIRSVGSDVGELELGSGEQARSVKVRVRRASTRLGATIEIWDANGKVYFKAENRPRRGRPHKIT